MKSISVIIPVLNEELTIQRLLNELCKEKRLLEIIIVDGGSTDQTKVLCTGCDVTVIDAPRGRANQMNAGAQVARGEILYFVHADTIPSPSFFEDIQLAVSNGAQIGGFRFRFDKASIMLRVNSFFTRFNVIWTRGGDQTLFITRDFFNTLNGYDPYYEIMEEYDLIKRSSVFTSFHLIPKAVLVSARKYTTNSWLRVQMANFTAMRMFLKGKKPSEIKSYYKGKLNPF